MEMSFKGFSIFSSGDHFVQQNETILAILAKRDKRNISVKSHFEILFLALAAILFSPAEPF